MGFFNKILKGIGFSDGTEEEKEHVFVNKNIKNQAEIMSSNPVTTDEREINVSSLVVYAPKSNDEVKMLVDCLKNGEAIIVNLGGLNSEKSQRILDYLTGSLYALNGTISRLQGELYVLTPKNIRIKTI